MSKVRKLEFYTKSHYGREDSYLIENETAKAIMLITGRDRKPGEYPISNQEMSGLRRLGYELIQVIPPIKK